MLPLYLATMLIGPVSVGKQPRPDVTAQVQTLIIATNQASGTNADVVYAATGIVRSNFVAWMGNGWEAEQSQNLGGLTKTVWTNEDGFRFSSVNPNSGWTLATAWTTNYTALPGTLAEHLLTNAWARTNLSRSLFTSTTHPSWVRNTNSSLWGLTGMTAMNVRNSRPGYYKAGVAGYNWCPFTALTRRHAISAGHQGGEGGTGGTTGAITTNWAGTKVYWVSASNSVVERTIVAKWVDDKADYTVIVLDADLPPEIDVMRCFYINPYAGETNYVSYGDRAPDCVGPSWRTPLNNLTMFVETATYFGKTFTISTALKPLHTCQHWMVFLGDGPDLWSDPAGWDWMDPHRWCWDGDSGSAKFYIIGNEIFFHSLLNQRSCWGEQPSAHLQNIMDALTVYAGADPADYKMQQADLSGWPTY